MRTTPSPAHFIVAIVAGYFASPAAATEVMPVAQQNALVQKYCAVCHTDASNNGGLSLQHFDAATASPSLTGMMLSKLTSGVSLQTARQSSSDADASALIDQKRKAGAMGAAGIPIPDKATVDALIHAFTVESARATDWTLERSFDTDANASTLTASLLRETVHGAEAEAYRLIASCNSSTHQGYVQLAWSPVPQTGTLAASVDGNAATEYRVEGSERMGNGSPVVLHNRADLVLADTRRDGLRNNWSFPTESLTIRDLFPAESVTFSFTNLPRDTRQQLAACFPGKH